MKNIACIEVDADTLSKVDLICPKWTLACERCGAKLYDLNELWAKIVDQQSSLSSDSEEYDFLTMISCEIVFPFCERISSLNMAQEEFLKYEYEGKYPRDFLRIERGVYLDDEGNYLKKQFEKIYLYLKPKCPCVQLMQKKSDI